MMVEPVLVDSKTSFFMVMLKNIAKMTTRRDRNTADIHIRTLIKKNSDALT